MELLVCANAATAYGTLDPIQWLSWASEQKL